MIVYALVFSVGIEHGYEELIGLYTSEEKLNEAKEADIKNNTRFSGTYFIKELTLDEELRVDLASW